MGDNFILFIFTLWWRRDIKCTYHRSITASLAAIIIMVPWRWLWWHCFHDLYHCTCWWLGTYFIFWMLQASKISTIHRLYAAHLKAHIIEVTVACILDHFSVGVWDHISFFLQIFSVLIILTKSFKICLALHFTIFRR